MAVSCGSAGEHADGGDERPCGGALDGFLPVFGETAASSEPREGSFDDPAARQDFEAFRRVGSLDDFDSPLAHCGQSLAQFFAGIAPIGEHMTQPCPT
jgi:hypothetical protein